MYTKLGLIPIMLICLLTLMPTVNAQTLQNIDIKNLNSSQIKQAAKAFQSSGLSINQAVAEARKNGASEVQIQELIKRMNLTKGVPAKTDTTELSATTTEYGEFDNNLFDEQSFLRDSLLKDAVVNKDSLNFGSYLFQGKNLSFEPNLNIQTPKHYELSIGDEIIINIWGHSIADYQLTVDRNGQIQIPKIGPVYLLGKTFDQVSKLIRRRLIAIYADMGGSNPNTFAQVNMGRLRSIQISIVGDAEIPGTYTLPATAAVFNALYLSGGPSEYGSFRNIQIHRNNELYKTIDVYDFLLRADQSNNVILKNGDVIFIPIATKRVLVSGEFKRKAFFELNPDETLNDLLYFTGGFTDAAYTLNLKIFRKTQAGMEMIDVPQSEYTNIPISNGDNIHAEAIRNDFNNLITIAGSVYRPGKYQWQENLMLSELILKADGIVPSAQIEMGHLTRVNIDSTLSLISFNVKEVLIGVNDFALQKKDSIMIKSHFELRDALIITVDGRVREEGNFGFLENMSVLDAIYLAGGFKEDADTNFVQISRRLSPEDQAVMSDKLLEVFSIPISRTLKANDSGSGFELKPFDHISIRKAPGAVDHGLVQINGEVVYEGYYAIQNKKDKISDLVEWSGGLSNEAYVEAATLTKVDAGSVGIDLQKILDNPNSRFDLKLSPGDVLTIPEKPETVNVFGEVQNPFAMVYEPNRSIKYYIQKSGGWGDRPYKRRVYVTYPDGSSASTKNFIAWRYPKVKPGAKIYVPKKPDRSGVGDVLGKSLATASTLASLGMTIAVLANLLKN